MRNPYITGNVVTGFFQIDFNALTPDEARMLQFVSTSPHTLTEVENQFSNLKIKPLLHNLTELGLLRRTADSYEVGSLFLAEWLKTSPTHHATQGGVTNRMMRDVAKERIASLYRQLLVCVRHLGHLEVQQAKQGSQTPPNILIEIEDYKTKIAGIEVELAELGENITPFQLSEAE